MNMNRRFRTGSPDWFGSIAPELQGMADHARGWSRMRAPRHGIHAGADAQYVNLTTDGVDLTQLWNEYQALINASNDSMNTLLQVLTFPTNRRTEPVFQGGEAPEMEDASEFGVATADILAPGYFNIAYDFREYDARSAFTWKFLRRAPASIVSQEVEMRIAAYRRRVFMDAMRAMFRKTNKAATINGSAYTVYRFYNADGTVPPEYAGTTFDGTHDHYRVNGNAAFRAVDLDNVLDDFDSHGYRTVNGYTVVFLLNRQEANAARAFRTAANGGTGVNAGRYDFIPAPGQPGQIMTVTQQMVGQTTPPSTWNGLTVIGSYGNALLVQEDLIPAGYVAGLASGGPLLPSNPLGFYQEPGYEGLRFLPGPNPSYPIQESNWWAGFGYGVRHRGAGMIVQIKASGSYDVPAAYA